MTPRALEAALRLGEPIVIRKGYGKVWALVSGRRVAETFKFNKLRVVHGAGPLRGWTSVEAFEFLWWPEAEGLWSARIPVHGCDSLRWALIGACLALSIPRSDRI